MIKRPDGLSYIKCKIFFNMRYFDMLEVDLDHINKNERSSYTSGEVLKLVTDLLDSDNLVAESERKYKGEECQYFAKKGIIKDKKYKVVFCICSDRPYNIGVITLFKVRR